MLKQRVITALVLLPIVLWCVFGPQQVLAFPLFAAALVVVAAWEWTAMMRWQAPVQRAAYVAVVALLLLNMHGQTLSNGLGRVLAAASLFWLVALIWVRRYPLGAERWDKPLMLMPVGLILLVPTWAGLVQLHAQSPWWLMYVFLLVWGADVGAYFAGRRFGRVKLAPAVSPAKTREGLYGGLVTTVLIMLLVAYQQGMAPSKAAVFLLVSLVTVFASVLGDLLESMIKRRAGIKDSGSIFPGHGGALDRIDSITAAAPVFLTGWWLAGGF